jgi:hypothetical protein
MGVHDQPIIAILLKDDKNKDGGFVTLQLRVQRPIGSGGGLFTRSDSAAHPLPAEQLSSIDNVKNR